MELEFIFFPPSQKAWLKSRYSQLLALLKILLQPRLLALVACFPIILFLIRWTAIHYYILPIHSTATPVNDGLQLLITAEYSETWRGKDRRYFILDTKQQTFRPAKVRDEKEVEFAISWGLTDSIKISPSGDVHINHASITHFLAAFGQSNTIVAGDRYLVSTGYYQQSTVFAWRELIDDRYHFELDYVDEKATKGDRGG